MLEVLHFQIVFIYKEHNQDKQNKFNRQNRACIIPLKINIFALYSQQHRSCYNMWLIILHFLSTGKKSHKDFICHTIVISVSIAILL